MSNSSSSSVESSKCLPLSSLVLSLLRGREYALALSPGFFRFYALIGCLQAMEEFGVLNASHVSGSSAGAIVGGFYAAGMCPSEMVKLILEIKREDIWDVGFGLGLLQGQLLQSILETRLPKKLIEECEKPLGVAAFEIYGWKTKTISSGSLATAIRASCCFPGLFSPVVIDGYRCIDGGVYDRAGLLALPGIPASSNLIVNIVCDNSLTFDSRIPERFAGASLLTIEMNNIPDVSPFSMDTTGPLAYETARSAMALALTSGNLQQIAYNHWILHVDGNNVDTSTANASSSSSNNSSCNIQADNEGKAESNIKTQLPSNIYSDNKRARSTN